jgi:uncharacterized iron-regulated membrane protein
MSAAPIVTRDTVSGASARPEREPVFVDSTGHRRRWLRLTGYAAAIGCLLFVIALVTSLLWSPITPHKANADTKAQTTTSQSVSAAHTTDKDKGGGDH